MLVLLLFAILLVFVGVALAIVDVPADLAQSFVVAKDVFQINVVTSFGFDFFRSDAVGGAQACASCWGFCVGFLARHQCHGHQSDGRSLNEIHVHDDDCLFDFELGCFNDALKLSCTHRPWATSPRIR